MKIYISVVDAKRKKQTFPLGERPIFIGRSRKSHVVIHDDLTSSQHMKIFLKDGCVFIEDLKSKNGIFLNGIKVFKQRIYLEDKVKLGDTLLYFEEKKMDQEAIRVLTPQDSTRISSNELTLELETHKERTRRIDRNKLSNKKSSSKKDFVKDSKLYAGAAENKEKLQGPTGKKLIFLEYLALFIDFLFSLIFSIIPFAALKSALPETFAKVIKPENGINGLFEGQALYLTGGSLLFGLIIFKFIRARKKGSLGEKILGLN